MSASFHLIKPGERLDFHELATKLNADRFGVRDAVFDAVSLADSAAAFFRGVFPTETPHFIWDQGMYLPWYRDYLVEDHDDRTLSAKCIRGEVLRIAQELSAVGGTREDSNPWPQVTFNSYVLAKSERLMMQGLAVEVMLSVDGFLSHISGGFLPESLSYFAAAYKNTIECTCHAQRILGCTTAHRP
jgi:hypothetical protein